MAHATELDGEAATETRELPGIAYIEGAYCPVTEAKIPVLDWGFLRSDATYDVVHVWDGRFFRLDKHIARFMNSAAQLRLTVPVDEGELRAILAECVRRSGLREAYVEMVCTRGFSPTFARDPRAAINRFYAFSLPFSWVADAEQRERGLHLIVSSVQRIPPESVDPTIKNYHWLDFVNGLFEAYVEMVCTRGFSPTFARDPRAAINRFYAFSLPFSWVADAEQRERGLHLIVSSVQRIPPESVDPTVKNYHWLDFVNGLFEAYDRGGENVILCDSRGDITEGPGFNVFIVAGGEVATPPGGVLQGITRQTALDLCAELGIAAHLRVVSAEALKRADEVFITSTAGGIMAVTRIDDGAIGDGRPGPLTRRLTDLYWDKHRDPDWTTAIAY